MYLVVCNIDRLVNVNSLSFGGLGRAGAKEALAGANRRFPYQFPEKELDGWEACA